MTVRTVAFGDLEAGVWGACWDAEPAIVVLGERGASPRTGRAALTVSEGGPAWQLSGEGIDLAVSGDGEAAGGGQLCRVSGEFQGRELECPGLRTGPADDLDLARYEAMRRVAAWFGPGEGLALTAYRPRGAKGQDRDEVTATVFEGGGARPVADPRLSTTYTPDGIPLRTGLELWLEEEDEDGTPREYPHRAAAEPLGAHASLEAGPVRVDALPLRWHYRGRLGAGVYLLARGER